MISNLLIKMVRRGTKCPRCHKANTLSEFINNHYTKNYECQVFTHTMIICCHPCNYRFAYRRDAFFPYAFKPSRYIAPKTKVYDTSGLSVLYAPGGIGQRAPELWATCCALPFSPDLRDHFGNWFIEMMIMHHARWQRVVYKILDHDGRLLPDLIEAYIRPLLGFKSAYTKVTRRLQEWESISYSGAAALFAGDDV